MKWFILYPLNLLTVAACMITNFIVCLFANEVGELPRLLRRWQTWDDSLDSGFFVKEHAPKIFRYDYDSKYYEIEGTSPELEKYGLTRWYARLKDGATFTIKERIQRYFCRVLWLMRNPAYGFSFWTFGVETNNMSIVKIIDEPKRFFAYDKSVKSIFSTPWIYKDDRQISKHIRLSIYIGWKLPKESREGCLRSMIANRIVFRFI